jgi:SAM-dependent methyltransferase
MKDGYTLLRCARCGLVAVSPIPPSTNEIYAAPDYFSGAAKGFGYVDYDADKEAMRGVFQEYLAQAEKLLPMKDKLLDVGAATGFFVALAEARGWKGEGIEVSDYAAAKGRDRGLRIITGTLESVALVPGTYGVVTMFDVIEHVRDPRTAISLAADVLGKNGVLLVTTPDAGSVLARLLRAHWHLVVPPEHLYYFTKQSMTVLLESLGFDTISITHPGKRFTLRYFFATVARWCPVPPLPWLADYFARHAHLGDRSIPFNTYDNLFVVAHKR